jgi:hypothetical protein
MFEFQIHQQRAAEIRREVAGVRRARRVERRRAARQGNGGGERSDGSGFVQAA